MSISEFIEQKKREGKRVGGGLGDGRDFGLGGRHILPWSPSGPEHFCCVFFLVSFAALQLALSLQLV